MNVYGCTVVYVHLHVLIMKYPDVISDKKINMSLIIATVYSNTQYDTKLTNTFYNHSRALTFNEKA